MALLQRVSEAKVVVDDHVLGAIGPGLLVFVGVEKGDARPQAERLLERIIGYRIFADERGRMNLSLADTGGELLLVPQFTLPADTDKGMRPSLSPAAPPEEGERLFDYLMDCASAGGHGPKSGRFSAHMRVQLLNDGPVTFMLRVPPPA